MDDSCAVCAEPLEWAAYGACGHREVCSTCVVRLRFVMNDKRCCICKSDCPSVFITKAMGDYTRIITDFSSFPPTATEGQNGDFYYHEDTQAYFDDSDHYKMIRAMCRLSCSVCDKAENIGPGPKRRNRFRSIEQLKGHLYHQHYLLMCNLCLEGRKVFICEQKLYTRLQLNQHIKSGDSEIDEVNGFTGHPSCEFCKSPFYGDNELYMHMSTEHYTCHICQRQHPGQYDYFRNYDDLETHFRQEHFLCESDDCLAKKFVVFVNEQELKRHNALEHAGHMSRAQRNAALQIPTSFRYRRPEQEQQRGRGRGRNFRPDTSSESPVDPVHDEPVTQLSTLTNSFESQTLSSFPPLNQTDQSETLESSNPRYALALNQNSRGATNLIESSFPPLSGTATGTGTVPVQGLQGLARHHAWQRRRPVGTVKVVHPRARVSNPNPNPNSAFPSLQRGHNAPVVTGIGTSVGTSSSAGTGTGFPSLQRGHNSSTNSGSNPKVSNNINKGGPSSSSNPRVVPKVPVLVPPVPVQEDVKNANKTLVERIKQGLDNDEERFELFKSISAEYRKGDMSTLEYLSCVEQFQLSSLVPELARLLPDLTKQRELTEAYYAKLRFINLTESAKNGTSNNNNNNNSNKGKKGKGKETREDNFLETVKKLQEKQRVNEEEKVEVLSKDGYRASGSSKGKMVISHSAESSNNNIINGDNIINVESSSKKNKKSSKFLRVRLGDGSVAALYETGQNDPPPEKDEKGTEGSVPVRGVWRNNGGQKLAKDLFK